MVHLEDMFKLYIIKQMEINIKNGQEYLDKDKLELLNILLIIVLTQILNYQILG
jgi:hypothetical protein